MRYFLVTLLLLSYPGLLIAVYWLPSSGPRQVLSLCIAKDGSFTTSSADVDFHQKAIDFWAPDLTHKKTINSSGYLVGWAHALSPDGNTVAVITTDGRSQIIEVVSVADDTLEVAIDAPKELSGLGNLHFCGSSESILLAERNDAFVFSQDGKLNQQLQSQSFDLARFVHSPLRYFATINDLPVPEPSGTGLARYETEYRFYDAETTPHRLIYLEKRPSDDWYGQGVAIGSDGTIAVQHPGHIQVRDADGKQRKIEWPMERGELLEIDPTMSYLLLVDRPQHSNMIVDAGTGKVLASRKSDDSKAIWTCKFQDSAHVLFNEGLVDAASRQVVRWNWREDTESSMSVGGTTYETELRRTKWLGVAVLLWFLVATWVARTSQQRFKPTVVVVSVAVLCCVWAYHHPFFEYHYVKYDLENISWLVLTTIWLGVPVLVCLVACKAPDKLARRLWGLFIVSAVSGDRLHHLLPVGSWFFPLLLLFVLTWLVASSVIIHYRMQQRKKSHRADRALSVNSQSASYWLMDLLLLIAAIGVVFAVLSNFDEFDQNLPSITWALGCSIPLAFMAAIAGWSSLSNAAWWKRYPPLVCFAFCPWVFMYLAYVINLRFFTLIKAGAHHPMLHPSIFLYVISAFTAFLVYALWLYRGTTIASQPDAVTEPLDG